MIWMRMNAISSLKGGYVPYILSYPFQVSEDVPITMLFPAAVGNQHHYEPRSYDYPENVDEETEVGNNEISVSPNNRKDIF